MQSICQPKYQTPGGVSPTAPVPPAQPRRAALLPALLCTAAALAVLLWGTP